MAECEDDSSCTLIHGSKLDLSRDCQGELESVGCKDLAQRCAVGPRELVDHAGQHWLFPGSCTPGGWKAVDGGVVSDPDFDPEAQSVTEAWPVCQD